MKATEIRIGNVFNIDNRFGETELLTVFGTSNYNSGHVYDDCNNIIGLEELKPIPLTLHWLFKLGFDGLDIGNYTMLLSTNTFCDLINNDYRISKNIKYVHQLQNLYFALTNKELKINLK